jgi:transcriptional regulator of acetoin/glycerol metabolism
MKGGSMDKKQIQKILDDAWPKAKKELEKVIKETKVLIDKGEKKVVDLTDKSIRSIKSGELQLKREKLYRDLGKSIADKPVAKWSKTAKAHKILTEIKKVDREISSLKTKKAKKK